MSGEKAKFTKVVVPASVSGSKISYNYLIVISAQKRGKNKVYTL